MYMGSEESAGEEVGRGRNEDVEMDVWCGVTKMVRIKKYRIRGTTKACPTHIQYRKQLFYNNKFFIFGFYT